MSEAKKPKRNWPKYNEAVVQRGAILLPLESLKGWQQELQERYSRMSLVAKGLRDFEGLRPWVRQAQRRAKVAVGAHGHAPF